MKHLFLLLLVLLFTFSPNHVTAQSGDNIVVVLSMDGFRSDYPLLNHTPTLDQLAETGVKSAFRPSFPSNTFPNHYSMATGLHPDKHGIINNNFYSSELGQTYLYRNQADVTNPTFYKGEPIWNTAEKQGIRSAVFYWVGSEAPIQDMRPTISKSYDKSISYYQRADSVLAWLNRPEEIRPRLIMWYLEEPDATAHRYSIYSDETTRKIGELDGLLAYFIREAQKLPVYSRIDLIVLSDHGMSDFSADKYVNLDRYLPRDSFEHVFAGVPAFLYPKPGYAQKAMEVLSTIPYITAYRKEDLPEIYQFGSNKNIGEIIVLPEPGSFVDFRKDIEPRSGAAHGYDNYHPEMEAIFYASGPSFRHNYEWPVMANVNLYLILCRLLNLIPAENDGDYSEIQGLFK